jgi:hypothetical protein
VVEQGADGENGRNRSRPAGEDATD